MTYFTTFEPCLPSDPLTEAELKLAQIQEIDARIRREMYKTKPYKRRRCDYRRP